MHLAEVRRRLYSSVKKAREALQACRTRSSRPHHVATHGEKHSAQTLANLHSLQRRRKSHRAQATRAQGLLATDRSPWRTHAGRSLAGL